MIPWSCGSIMSGQRSHEVRMVAFSILIRSPGKPSLFHCAISASSMRSDKTSRFGVIGIGVLKNETNQLKIIQFKIKEDYIYSTLRVAKKGIHMFSMRSRRYCFVKHPTYEINAVTKRILPGKLFSWVRKLETASVQRIFSDERPPTRRFAKLIV